MCHSALLLTVWPQGVVVHGGRVHEQVVDQKGARYLTGSTSGAALRTADSLQCSQVIRPVAIGAGFLYTSRRIAGGASASLRGRV